MYMNHLSILYKSLLNRNPNGNEILKFNTHRNLKIVNKEIIVSDEYKSFLNKTKKHILKSIKKVFLLDDVELTIHPILEYKFMEIVRNNNYNHNFLEKELTKLFNYNEPNILKLINKLYFDEKNINLENHIKSSRMILLTNNFNLNELEFHHVSQPNYLKMVKNKLKNI